MHAELLSVFFVCQHIHGKMKVIEFEPDFAREGGFIMGGGCL